MHDNDEHHAAFCLLLRSRHGLIMSHSDLSPYHIASAGSFRLQLRPMLTLTALAQQSAMTHCTNQPHLRIGCVTGHAAGAGAALASSSDRDIATA